MLVFLAVLFVGLEVVVRRDQSADPGVRKLVDGALVSIGVFYLAYFVISVLRDLDGFLTRDNVEAFLAGPVLTVALIPSSTDGRGSRTGSSGGYGERFAAGTTPRRRTGLLARHFPGVLRAFSFPTV